MSEDLTKALEIFARVPAPLVAREVVAQLRSGDVGMIDTVSSPLGRKRHCAVVRRLVASGTPGAAIVGRRHLLSRELLDKELARLSSKPQRVREKPGEFDDLFINLRKKHGLELVPENERKKPK